MIETSQAHRCRDCGSVRIVRNGRNCCGSHSVWPGLREQQGSLAEGALQRGAQGRDAAGLSGALLAVGAQPYLRDHAQDPLLLQEAAAARPGDPLVHRRVQPLMLRVARTGAYVSFNCMPLSFNLCGNSSCVSVRMRAVQPNEADKLCLLKMEP